MPRPDRMTVQDAAVALATAVAAMDVPTFNGIIPGNVLNLVDDILLWSEGKESRVSGDCPPVPEAKAAQPST